jgi:hypothetical protein
MYPTLHNNKEISPPKTFNEVKLEKKRKLGIASYLQKIHNRVAEFQY